MFRWPKAKSNEPPDSPAAIRAAQIISKKVASEAAEQAAIYAAVPWLLACALATTAPHIEHQPYWLMALAALTLAWRTWLWISRRPLPPSWTLTLFVLGCTIGIWFEYRTLFGRDAGVGLLVLFMALKPMEVRRRRDAMVVVMLGLFLLLTHYFYSQTIPTGVWLLIASTLETATLIRIFGGPQPPASIMRHAGLMLVQAVPFMVVLFLLFPRVNGPLWGLPQDAHSGNSGLPDTITPGSISNLAQNGAIAFRVRFLETNEGTGNQRLPVKNQLYWRGPVMDDFDGRTWRPSLHSARQSSVPKIEAHGDPIIYELTIEPHNQRWLLALDVPLHLPENAELSPYLQATTREPIRQRSRFQLSSATDFNFGRDEPPAAIQAALSLPKTGNSQARALADAWRQKRNEPLAIVAEALQFFRRENFVYTLQPPLLGENSVDQLLFETRRGFCEHYAAAFVFLMRAAGVPARIVAGYQGGEFNPVDGFVVVRQSDAHAWAEIWTAEAGWQRVDPTAAIAPSRVEVGIANALQAGEPLPSLVRIDADWLRQMRFRWEAVNNRWNQWVLGYNPDRQRELLKQLGLVEIDWRGMATLLAALCGLVLLVITAWALSQRQNLDAAQRLWLSYCWRLARVGLAREPWEGPQDYAWRLSQKRPELAEVLQTATEAYIAVRYARPKPDGPQGRQNDARELKFAPVALKQLATILRQAARHISRASKRT